MADSINVTTRMINGDKFVYWLNRCPRYMHQEARKWFLDIRKRFVGTQKTSRSGTYTRWLKSKNAIYAKGLGIKWSEAAATTFKGFVKGGEEVGNVTLRMGVPPNQKSKFVQGMEKRQAGNYNITSNNWMPVPNYKNMNAFGYKTFRHQIRLLRNSNDLFTIRRGSVIFYISKRAVKGGSTLKKATLFKLTKSVVEPHMDFQFESKFGNEFPRYMQLGENRLKRAARALEKGYVK